MAGERYFPEEIFQRGELDCIQMRGTCCCPIPRVFVMGGIKTTLQAPQLVVLTRFCLRSYVHVKTVWLATMRLATGSGGGRNKFEVWRSR
jgi:hypothetical protein